MKTGEWGLFSNEGLIEGQFYSREEAEAALRERYSEEDELTVEELEEEDEDEEEGEEEEETEDEE